jgi:hypothetical protein
VRLILRLQRAEGLTQRQQLRFLNRLAANHDRKVIADRLLQRRYGNGTRCGEINTVHLGAPTLTGANDLGALHLELNLKIMSVTVGNSVTGRRFS